MSRFLSRFRHLAATAQEDEARPDEEEARAAEEEEEERNAEEEEREKELEEEEEKSAEEEDEEEADLEEDEEETPAARAARRRERRRCAAILGSREAAGRVPLACSLAFDTNLSPNAARKVLAAAPREGFGGSSPLSAAMRQVRSPKLGPGGDAAAPRSEAELASQVIATHRRLRGANRRS